MDDLREPLAALHKQCNKRVWGLHKNELCYDISEVMQHPPDELFATISVDTLLQQFNRLQQYNTHFQCSGPEGWHFVGKRIRRRTMDAVQIRNEVRLLNQPRWFQTYFKDLIVNGVMTLCKFLPTPERAMLTASAKQASRWQQLKPAAKRHKISETAEERYNPKVMDDGLWQQLKINTLSLPSCLRPGKHAR